MLLPYGDNVERRSFPVVPILLILTSVAVLLRSEQIIRHDDAEFHASTEFYHTFGLAPDNLATGQVIGLISYMFMHDGIFHLLGNMVILWAMACSLEAALGRFFLLALYCFWGAIGGLCHVYMNWGSTMPLVGASGAVAGLIGAYTVAFGPFARLKCLMFFGFIPLKVRVPALAFGVLWFAMQLLEASADPNGLQNISWYAHIGGFLAGAGTMFFFKSEVHAKLNTNDVGDVSIDAPKAIAKSEEAVIPEYFIAEQVAAAQADLDSAMLQPVPAPPACSYCGAQFDVSMLINPKLAVCHNAACQRMNYLDETQAAFFQV